MPAIVFTEKYGHSGQEIEYSAPEGLKITVVKNPALHCNAVLQHLKKVFLQIFLPQGYPTSVSKDYYNYQFWDTAQAFYSTITGILTTHAIFKGVGVGDSTATALSAAVTWILKDGSGMAGRILFAWWKGTTLDTDCKKWRLAADVINDIAMFLEMLLTIQWFRTYNSLILCLSMSMKSIVCVAGGATRAVITQHQAIRGNMADVSAKDGSQETCVNLVGSVVGLYILLAIGDYSWCLWCLFLLLTILHLHANYKAVRSLMINTLNPCRFNLIIRDYFKSAVVPHPDNVNEEESVILGIGFSDQSFCGHHIYLGCSLSKIVSSLNIRSSDLQETIAQYKGLNYLIFVSGKQKNIYVLLHKSITDLEILQSYFHAISIGKMYTTNEESKKIDNYAVNDTLFQYVLGTSSEAFSNKWAIFVKLLGSSGWNTNRHQMPVEEWRATWDNEKPTHQNG